VVTIDGDPWFVAADACRALEMDVSKGTHQHMRGLDASEKRLATRDLFRGIGHRPTTIISESGLYKLILRSDKPQAKPFQDWVTKEVLPAIRKDGA
jgi:prophage antirepressor-like protein